MHIYWIIDKVYNNSIYFFVKFCNNIALIMQFAILNILNIYKSIKYEAQLQWQCY